MNNENSITYNSTHTAYDFHCDNSLVRLLFGPVGCGKSVANLMEIWRRACEQAPGFDGIRRSRWAVVRNTYPELKATTIKTWQAWFPEKFYGNIKWDSPISHHIRIDDIDLEVMFVALDSESDVKKLMSFELTGIYINELQYIPKLIFDKSLERIDRYPDKKTGAGITWTGLICDTNPPDTDHWIYKLFEKDRPEGYKIFKYQPALEIVNEAPVGIKSSKSLDGTIYIENMNADYVAVQNNPQYWFKLVPGFTDDQIKVNILGQYGVFIDGKPVHPEYNDRLHYSPKELLYNPDIELGLGWDFGLTPACSVVQLSANGQLLVLAELYSDDMALRDFAECVVIPYLNLHFPQWKMSYVSRHDPAGQVGSQTDGVTCQQILRELNISSLPAANSNAPTARRDGLKYFLRRLVGGQPGYLLSPRIDRLRKALMGNYQYAKIKSSVSNQFHEKPLKNMYSHIAEAHEYIAMHYARNEKIEKTDGEDLAHQLASNFNRLQQSRKRLSWHAR